MESRSQRHQQNRSSRHHKSQHQKPIYKKFWFWIVIFVLIVGFKSMLSSGQNETADSHPKSSKIQSSAKTSRETKEDNRAQDSNVNASDSSPSTTTTQDSSQPSVPTEYKSALKSAKTYSDMMHMSKQGLYEQLTSEYGEKFSAEAAQYAIDNLQVDYNDNALKTAKDYQDTQNMSPEGIRDQLTSEYGEKFTQQEADYAIQHLNS